MNKLLRAELLKLRTTRTIYALFGATVGLVALSVTAGILTAGRAEGSFALETSEGVRNVLGSGWPAATIALVLGILAVSGELRHRTLTSAFLVTPDRGRLVMAKMVSYAIVGFAFAVTASVVTLLIALPWLSAKDIDVSLLDGDVATVLLGLVVAAMLYGLLGVGIGALVHNQVAALTIALVWTYVLEGVLVAVVPEVGKWLPGGAATALSSGTTTAGDLLPAWSGGLLLAAYALGSATLGSRRIERSDLT
jgi:ABC-2 type transport system permease protein